MRIRCNKCNYIACGTDLTSHIGCCLAKALAPAAVPFFMNIINDYFKSQTRSFLDDTTAVAANVSGMKCPSCENTECWTPYPIGQDLEESAKKENVISKSL